MLTSSLGEEAADEVVGRACSALGVGPKMFSKDDALRVFEFVAQQPGLVGIAGRFAKSRCILGWGADKKP
jgi:hypothetical protein